MQAKWEEMFGIKDEGEGMKDEIVKVRKPRKKAVAKKAESVALSVSKGGMRATVKKLVARKAVKETKKTATKKKPSAKKTIVKKSRPKAKRKSGLKKKK